MECLARSVFSDETESAEAGRNAGTQLLTGFGPDKPKVVLAYATMNHDQAALLDGLRAALGPDVPVLGGSVQGVVSNAQLTEDGFALGLLGLGGGGLHCAAAAEHAIETDSKQKGRRIAQAIKRELGVEPKVFVLVFDPLCGADIGAILDGIALEIECPVMGGAAGQPWGRPLKTFQYWEREVLSHSMVGVGLSGAFDLEIGLCHGTSPSGIVSVITKAAANHVLEMDGRPAGDVWRETTGCRAEDLVHQSHFATWAVGVEIEGAQGQRELLIRGAFGFDPQTNAIILQTAVPEGTRVMLHHRTVERILGGTEHMARDLCARLKGRRAWAVLGFECAARTFPFLGQANTRREHASLRATVAPDSPWLGMMAWGEIGPCAGRSMFHNYTYPLLILTDPKA